ncbi:MAG: LPS export ABC transporter permease LptF [Burkholderiaceae bacterium]
MIFGRSIVSELTSTASAVFTVLFSIIFSVGLVRIIGQAAGGRIDNEAVFELVALTALTWLPIILTLTLFVSVLMALTRAYRDSEMVVWFTAGRSLTAWIGPVIRFAWPIIVSVALLALFVTPWANAQIEQSRERFEKRDDVSRVAPGRFVESGGSDRVFFVESVDVLDGQVHNVFVSMRNRDRESLIVATKGIVEVAPNGDRFLVLEQGRRYEGTPGKLEYRTMEFDRYAIRLESRADQPLSQRRAKTLTLMQLVSDPSELNLGELLWRAGLPIVALILTLLAIPLAYVNPRVGRSVNLIVAVLLFAVYLNVLNTVHAYVQQGRLPFGVGVWVVHAAVLLLVLMLFLRRVYMWRWLPRWLSRSSGSRRDTVGAA